MTALPLHNGEAVLNFLDNKINYQSPKSSIFFDVGNTLLFPYPSITDICLEILKSEGMNAEREKIDLALRKAEDFYDKQYFQDDTFWASEKRISNLWVDLYSMVIREVGFKLKANSVSKKIYNEFGKTSRWKLYDEVIEVLKILKNKNKKLGVISNWDSRLVDILLGLGLGKYFDFIISSANVNNHKPTPGIFELALERAGVMAREAVHVGDHYYADVIGARAVGIAPVLIDRFERIDKADCPIINNLGQLKNVIVL